MYKYEDVQISIYEFEQPAGMHLKAENRWVKKAKVIPWGAIEQRYAKLFTNQRDTWQSRCVWRWEHVSFRQNMAIPMKKPRSNPRKCVPAILLRIQEI